MWCAVLPSTDHATMSSLTYHGDQLLFPQSRTLQSLQRAVRSSQHSLHNRLLSIDDDIRFLESLLPHYPSYPVLPNLRCGAWYVPPAVQSTPQQPSSAATTSAVAAAAAYFKSSDGHCGHWRMSSVRLNVAVVELAAATGGCWLVDSTRQGKRWAGQLHSYGAHMVRHCQQSDAAVQAALAAAVAAEAGRGEAGVSNRRRVRGR